MSSRARRNEQRTDAPVEPISLDGRQPHEGLWDVLAVVMIVVAILFVIAVVSGSVADVSPGPGDAPAPASEPRS